MPEVIGDHEAGEARKSQSFLNVFGLNNVWDVLHRRIIHPYLVYIMCLNYGSQFKHEGSSNCILFSL
jgi:hypothetical protein